MKKVLILTALATLGALFTGAASATTYSHHKGENPCMFTLNNLKSNGYTENAVYTAEQIHSLLNKIDVQAKDVNTLTAGERYQVVYSCSVDHHLAHAILQATPVDGANRVTTNIHWTATKPVAP